MQKLAILGGGQLGKMLIQAGLDLDIEFHVLDSDADAPCKYLSQSFMVGSLWDEDKVWQFIQDKPQVTYEIEHINIAALERAEAQGIIVSPSAQILKTIQNKILQKEFFEKNGLPSPKYQVIHSNADLENTMLHFPVFYKLAKGGYDGRGVLKIETKHQAGLGFNAPGIIEEAVDIQLELAVMVARNQKGELKIFPPVEMVFDPSTNMVDYLISPANIPTHFLNEANEIALHLANTLQLVGVLAVELFYTTDGRLLVNELAPRPHNSMHHTIEANATSQFQQMLRAILGYPLGDTSLKYPVAAMVNLTGSDGHTGPAHYEGIERVLAMPDTWIHLYGKKYTRPGRKMGHITLTAPDRAHLAQKIRQVKSSIRVVSKQ